MRLEYVDRRAHPGDADPWHGAGTDRALLADLVAPLGRDDWSANLVLVDDAAMAELNRAWRGGEGVTDVLSFTYLEPAASGPCDLRAGENGAAGDLRLGAVPPAAAGVNTVGEIVIAPAYVRARCRREGWDPDQEWPLLVIHGCLHVLGWEHAAAADRRSMQAVESGLLARAGLAHPLGKRS